jgi:hypothetical protein
MEFEEAPRNTGDALAELATRAGAIDDALVPIMAGLIAATGWMAE